MPGSDPTHIVLVVPWFGGSHRAWSEGLSQASRHRIGLVTHAPEHWRWRYHGGPVTLAAAVRSHCAEFGAPDLVIVSSMTDVAALMGLARDVIGHAPVVSYRHESQLLHPRSPGQAKAPPDEAAALTEWRGMLAATETWFNSDFHRDAYLERVAPDLLTRPTAPDHLEFVEQAADRSRVVPVGVDFAGISTRVADRTARPVILFNQRWEADKAPGRVVGALERLVEMGEAFDVVLAGPRSDAATRPRLSGALRERIISDAELPRERYLELLSASDIVVTDADHEFFGIAPVEAIRAGCVPLFPDRQNYPDLVRRDRRFLHEGHDLVPRLLDTVRRVRDGDDELITATQGLAASMDRYELHRVTSTVDDRIDELVDDANT